MLAACASGPAAVPERPAVAVRYSGSTPPQADPKAAAEAEAIALLAAFRAPGGAVRLPRAPARAPSSLGGPFSEPRSADLLVRTAWWSYPGTPQQAADWIGRHAPTSSTAASGGSAGGPGEQVWFQGFDRAPTALLSRRTLEVQAVAFGGGTLLRVDAVVLWLPQRSANTRIPSGVTRLTVLALPGPGAVTRTPAGPAPARSATVTDQGLLRQVAALVDALPSAPKGVFSCPADTGATLRLEFYTGGSSPAVVVDSRNSGCLRADLSVRGGPQHIGLSTAGGFNQQVLTLLQPRFGTG